jgi:hypothetical protein
MATAFQGPHRVYLYECVRGGAGFTFINISLSPLGDERRACPWNKLGNLALLFKLQNKYV